MDSRVLAVGCALWMFGATPVGGEESDSVSAVAGSGRYSAAGQARRVAKNEAKVAEADRPAHASKDARAAQGSSLSVYVPPNSRGAVGGRTGGGSRGPVSPVRIAPLAPDHVGLTTREHPVLAWLLSADTDFPIEVTLIADGAIEPATVVRLPGPQLAGIHHVDLTGAQLASGVTYEWTVALVRDAAARDRDIVAGAAIRRASAPAQLTRELASAEPSYRVLARNGVWYDAIADLSAAIAAAPDDAALRAERAALLQQIGIREDQ